MNLENVTLCLTIGKRPLELQQTLASLLSYLPFEKIIAINDFGDKETNEIFLSCCPKGELINLQQNLGHHRAVDYMYQKVKTGYIFHCEDDWLFDNTFDITNALFVLENNPNISCIGVRKINDFVYNEQDRRKVQNIETNFGTYVRLDSLHDQWYGYSFNPHLTQKILWQRHAPFSQFKKERHISRFLRKQGYYMLYLQQGICHHIGHQSVANPPKTTWQKLKFW